jgi:tetratricopeptide (TPR) repeat protein
MGELGNYYHNAYEDGNRDVIAPLTAEEANLLHARRLALQRGWWHRVTSAMQGLDQLYDHTGRRAEWARLVAEIVPHFIDPATDGPLPGREEEWDLITHYRVRLAREARCWDEVERLQRVRVDWNRQQAAEALAMPEADLDDAARNRIRSLGASLHALGQILRERDDPACISAYEETAELMHRIGDRPAEAVAALNLGHVYMPKYLPALRDLDRAETWYCRSLELRAAGDRQGRAHALGQLGGVAFERFLEARRSGAPDSQLLAHLNQAARFHHQALDLLPPDAVGDLAVTHGQLGNIYGNAGDLERCLQHCREAGGYFEAADDVYSAAQLRFNVAVIFARAGRFRDALDYAQAALRGYETFGPRAASDIQDTRKLIAQIDAAMRQGGEG